MEERTITIPASDLSAIILDKDQQLRMSFSLSEFLSSLMSTSKLLKLSYEDYSDLIESLKFISNDSSRFQALLISILCIICKQKPIEIITSCSHGYCKDCFISYISQRTMNRIVLCEYEALSPSHISTTCQECAAPFTTQDLQKVFPNIEELIYQSKIRKINEDCNKKNQFTCLFCKKTCGKKMLLENSCMHMCRQCLQKQIIDESRANCSTCGSVFDIEEMRNSHEKCVVCKKKLYFVGDFMQELCPNNFYCVSCAIDTIDKGKCECHNEGIKLSDKLGVAERVLKTCVGCEEEKSVRFFLRHGCCSSSICFSCIRGRNNCISCGNVLSKNSIEQIEKYFQILQGGARYR